MLVKTLPDYKLTVLFGEHCKCKVVSSLIQNSSLCTVLSRYLHTHVELLASFPDLLHFFFVLWFAFSILHGSGRAAKNGEGLGTPIT